MYQQERKGGKHPKTGQTPKYSSLVIRKIFPAKCYSNPSEMRALQGIPCPY